ncbi:MAG: glycoside hydrolase family 48 protein, partial [Candidatus Margulisiibacteriota bacterium]
VSGQISKLQWTAQPGTTIDLNIDNIIFTADEETASEASAAPVSDADPLMPVTAVDGRRQSGRYLQVIQDLGNYFLNNQGNPPNATRRTEINGIGARAAFHVYEDNATHLCNGGATTSEAQALFFNFMALYAALTGKTEGAREAYAYLRYFMMPHDGAESPQLPDSQLGTGDDYPFLMHWMIDLSGEAQARTCPDGTPGTGVFGENTTYNRYDPTPASPPYASVARNTDGQVDLTQRQAGGGHHAASFSSAPDADQWLAEGAYWAQRYGLGDAATFLLNLRRGMSEGLTPSDAENYPNTMRFAIFWGEDQAPNLAFRGTTYQLYTGYQDPAAWEILGRHEWAQNIVKFLTDAQKKYKRLYRQDGPFMPVFKDGQWGWEGDDPSTYWMGFQYRTFAHLAHYYYLTGDENTKKLLDKFVSWYKRNLRTAEGQVSIPLELENGEQNTGSIRRRGYGPNEFALMAQGLILMAAKENDSELQQEAEKLLDYMLTQRADNGSFPYADPNPENSGTYGFHNAEAGIAYGLYTLLLEQVPPTRATREVRI